MRSPRAQIVVAIVASIVVLALFFFMFVSPRRDRLSEVRAEIETARQETVTLQAELDRLQALQDDAARLNARLVEVRKLVPENDELAQFIFQLQDEANRAGVSFVQVTPELPKPPPEGAQLAEIRLTIGAEGGYFSIQDFVRRLYELERALRVDILQMAGTQDVETGETTIDMEAIARIFFEIPPGTTVAPPATDPAAEPPAPEEAAP
ncbi:MAG TPA: type 4a pilus biogenesis protein PilO [Actinomycetota bacterium]|nr:type 4a pilus biogenesis protein PilO [Actinomycetota bacterium]